MKKKSIAEEMDDLLDNLTIVYSKKYTKLVKVVTSTEYITIFKEHGELKEAEVIDKYLDYVDAEKKKLSKGLVIPEKKPFSPDELKSWLVDVYCLIGEKNKKGDDKGKALLNYIVKKL